jgi:ATP phosphoribosyltransferase regulatory subunit HisZ
MASSLTSESPHQVQTIEEAQVLIDEAHAQEIFCRRIKELSEIRAKEAIAEACLAYKKLLDAEMYTGKVFYVVKASGFQAQNTKPAQPPVVVQINGGADGSQFFLDELNV